MSFGRLHVAPIVPSFLKQYPGIQLDMVLDDRMVDLMQEGFDVAIRVGDLPDSNLIARPLAPMRYVVCATPNYISEHGLPKTPAELTKHNCLLFSYSLHEWTFQRQGSHETVQVQGNYHVNNSEALREALLQGAGVGRIPTFIVGPDIQSGKLIQLLTEYTIPMKTLFAVFPERRHMPAKVRVFVDFLLDSLGGDRPYWDNFSDARNY
jgi:DNA-binding transcriptional LysR family regulator